MISRIFDFFENTQMMKYIMFVMYGIINLLFVVKYGIKQDIIPIYILIILFCLSHFFYSKVIIIFLKK